MFGLEENPDNKYDDEDEHNAQPDLQAKEKVHLSFVIMAIHEGLAEEFKHRVTLFPGLRSQLFRGGGIGRIPKHRGQMSRQFRG